MENINRYININEIGKLLLQAEKPARYAGGEFGAVIKKNAKLKTLIAFPDLYEIGMGNQAVKIIYNRLNELPDILCDRAFAPAPDFENILRNNNLPLYGLDTGFALGNFDLLMFSIGYELGLTGILTMLNISGIPLRCVNRNEKDPIVIAGGPAVSNPLPFSPFIDAFWIGEAEAGFFDLVRVLAEEKGRGASRTSLLEIIAMHPNIFVKGKEKVKRAVHSGFSHDKDAAIFPIPNMKIVQNHGTVEIMRGCPNGCRFCHAGFWYRPMRQKSSNLIIKQVNDYIEKGGWQEVSLSSLSSGDYCGVSNLVETLNKIHSERHVSFQMPSLRISGFSLDLLEKLSVTRKSGLTFAVETPLDAWQMAINKEVTRDSVISILAEAKKRGWKSAKFYFMIGLPINTLAQRQYLQANEFKEEQEIVNFILDISKRTRMKFNINVGVFIPKPHTPYQCVKQTDSGKAKEKLQYIRSKLKPLGHKVSTSDLLISKIEGLLSRGDERAGILCEKAFLEGSRLDAWDDYINKEKWEKILNENDQYVKSILNADFFHSSEHKFPWDFIKSGVTDEYLIKEMDRSENCQETAKCSEICKNCGVCKDKLKIFKNIEQPEVSVSFVNQRNKQVNKDIYRLLFSFSKQERAVFHGHLSLIEIFSMSLRRTGVNLIYTQGFNPLAKIEFASPLSVGVTALSEIACIDFYEKPDIDAFIKLVNKNLPQGILIKNAECFYIPFGIKQFSLSSLLWGSVYENKNGIDYIPAKEEKAYRQNRLDNDPISLLDLKRISVLAGNKESYFDAYRSIYPI